MGKHCLTIVFILLLLIPASSQKLKTTVAESGDTLYSTPAVKVYTKPGAPRSVADYLKISLYKTGHKGQPVLSLDIQTGRTSAFTIDRDSEVQISLQDGNIVRLYCRRDTESKISKLDYGCYIFPFYTIDAKSRELLEKSEITSIMVMSSLGRMNYDIKSKFGDTILKQFEKISSE